MDYHGQMTPVYGAMSVCSSTLGWLERQERERSDWETHAHLSRLGSSIQALIDHHNNRKSPSCDVPPLPTVEFIVCCLGVVTSLSAMIIKSVRNDLPNTSEKFRQQIGFLLDQIEEMVDRVEDIAEAWGISLDQDIQPRLDDAIKKLDPTKKDIPNWREALELLVSD